VQGPPGNIDPIAAMRNPAAFALTLHMMLAADAVIGFDRGRFTRVLLLAPRQNALQQRALAMRNVSKGQLGSLAAVGSACTCRVSDRCRVR
jgi:hypothetical protein